MRGHFLDGPNNLRVGIADQAEPRPAIAVLELFGVYVGHRPGPELVTGLWALRRIALQELWVTIFGYSPSLGEVLSTDSAPR